MKNKLSKRILSLIVCMAIVFAGIPTAFLNVGATDGNTITDHFDGTLNWEQVGSVTTSADPITAEGKFLPNTSVDEANGLVSIHTYTNWPTSRKLNQVTGSYKLNAANHGSLLVYYYKDINNWRGIWLQRSSTRLNLFYMIKESDPNDQNKVFFMKSSAFASRVNQADSTTTPPSTDEPINFTITYGEDGAISIVFTQGTTYTSQTLILSNAVVSKKNTSDAKVSTDAGATFSDYTETETGLTAGQHTFAAITDSKSAQFAMGNGKTGSVFDDIEITFDETAANKVDTFRSTYAELLQKDASNVTDDDKSTIVAALKEIDAFDADTKAQLNAEYILLNSMMDALYADAMSGSSYTEDFEDIDLWQQSGTIADGEPIVEQSAGNHVFKPCASEFTKLNAPTAYSHRYWPEKTLTSVTGTMYIGHTLSLNAPSNAIIYSYKDADNWRGIYFLPSTEKLNARFVGKEDGKNITYAYYAKYTTGTLTTLENIETTFTITYNEDGTASMVLENDTGVSAEMELIVETRGLNDNDNSYLKYINANYGAFGIAAISNGAANDWFDDITFNFGDTFETKEAEFKATYKDTLDLDPAAVTTANKADIEALYDAYNAISRDTTMAALLATEGTKVNELFNALIDAHKTNDQAIKIACVGDSITEGHRNYSISYPKQLQDMLDAKYGVGVFSVGNFGHSGTSAYNYFSVDEYKESLYFNPDIVITMFGTNDLSNSKAVYEHYYEKLAAVYLGLDSVDYFVAATSIISLDEGTDEKHGRLPAYREIVETIASENNWNFLDMCDATDDLLLADTDKYFKVNDQVHPTEAGYTFLAQAVLNYLENGDYGTPAEGILDNFDTEFKKENKAFLNAYNSITDESSTQDIMSAVTLYDKMYGTDYESYAYSKEYADKYEELIDKLVDKNVLNRPQMNSATIKKALVGNQDLRFRSEIDISDVEGYNVVEYGTIMIPNQFINTAQNSYYNNEQLMLGMKVARGDEVAASVAVARGTQLPEDGVFFATLSGSSATEINCSVRIAARTYVKYSNGVNTFVVYSNNTSNDYSNETPTIGVKNGIAVRSVYSIARRMAKAIVESGNTYGAIDWSQEIPEGTIAADLITNTAAYSGASCIEFVLDNKDILEAIVSAQQAG